MTTTCKYCDRCHRATVCWPRTPTAVGPLDLCGSCYWEYFHLVEGLATFYRPLQSDRRGLAPGDQERNVPK